MGSRSNITLYELSFTGHLLDSITWDGKVIIPQSSMTGKTKEEQAIKDNILKYHTLEGVISLNKNTFYGVGTPPCIAVFTTGIPHHKEKVVTFINFEDDGLKYKKTGDLLRPVQPEIKNNIYWIYGSVVLKVGRNSVLKPL